MKKMAMPWYTSSLLTRAAMCVLVTAAGVLVTAAAAAAASLPAAHARPPWLSDPRQPLEPTAECHTNDDLLDLCQRCAKLTKSPLAYPACCSADLQARSWCGDFVYFGLSIYDYQD